MAKKATATSSASNNTPVSDEEVVEALTTQMNIKDAAKALGRSYNWLLKKSHDLVEAGIIESRDVYPAYHRIGFLSSDRAVTVYFNAAAWKQNAYYIRGSFDGWTCAPGYPMRPVTTENGYYSAVITVPAGVEGVDFFIDNGEDINDAANLYQPTPGSNFHLELGDGTEFTIEDFNNAHSGKPANL